MLQAHTEFPYPGSVALLNGIRWRVRQLFEGGKVALIVRDGAGAHGSRREAVSNLVDANLVDVDGVRAVKGITRDSKRIALHVARHLRDQNEVVLGTLRTHLSTLADDGRLPALRDNAQLANIMVLLGWHKDGYSGVGFARTPVYHRIPKQASEI